MSVKLSNDPRFVEKLRDVVGLYLDPPAPRHRALGRQEVPDPGARPHWEVPTRAEVRPHPLTPRPASENLHRMRRSFGA